MSREPLQLDLLDWLAVQAPCPAPVESMPSRPAFDGTEPVLLTRVDPSSNMRRFYSVALATSLFGEAGVLRQWGRIGSHGQSRTDWYDEPSEAGNALKGLLRAKRKRGYSP